MGSGGTVVLDPVTQVPLNVSGPTGQCAAGYYCPENSTTPFGVVATIAVTDSNGVVTVTAASNANYCPAGTTNAFLGKASIADCVPCPNGTYGPSQGSNMPVCPGQCVAGKYGIAHGKTIEAAACALCPPGKFSGTSGSQYCSPCSIGSYSETSGTSVCTPCPLGSYGGISGSDNKTTCKPCPKGTYSVTSGQSKSGCEPCEVGKYGAQEGATSSSACKSCPDGTFTAVSGATDSSACARISYPCPPGMEPTAPPFALKLSDCIALVCPEPLVANESGCAGCAAGFYGNATACAPCGAPPALCPGLTSRPLIAPTALRADCVDALLQASAGRAPSAAIPSALSNLSGGFSSVAFTYVSSFFAATLFAGLVLALATYSRECVARHIEGVDKFGLRDPVVNGKPPTIQKTVVGGVVTAVALLVAFFLACYYLISALSFDNVSVISSIRVLHGGMLDDMAASGGAAWLWAPPYAPAAAAAGSSVGLGPDGSFSGLQVRVLAMGEPGNCGAPLSWNSRGGLTTGAWALENASAPLAPLAANASGCPAGAEAYSAIIFSCTNCTFESTAGLDFVLHYSCQALQLGVAAAGPAEGSAMNLAKRGAVVYTRFAPPSTLVGANSTTLLKSVQFSVSTLLAFVVDARVPLLGRFLSVPVDNLSGAGYLLGPSSATAAFSSLESLQGLDGSGFFPRENGVMVGVQLTQAGFYATANVQQVINGMQLVSQISSLLGLLGVFGALLRLARSSWKKKQDADTLDAATPVAAAAAAVEAPLPPMGGDDMELWAAEKLERASALQALRREVQREIHAGRLEMVALRDELAFVRGRAFVAEQRRSPFSAFIGAMAAAGGVTEQDHIFAPSPPRVPMSTRLMREAASGAAEQDHLFAPSPPRVPNSARLLRAEAAAPWVIPNPLHNGR